jgi:hypothetical protein
VPPRGGASRRERGIPSVPVFIGPLQSLRGDSLVVTDPALSAKGAMEKPVAGGSGGGALAGPHSEQTWFSGLSPDGRLIAYTAEDGKKL